MNNRKKITVASTISGSGLIKAGGSNVVHGLYKYLAQYYDIEIVYIAPVYERFRKYEIAPGLTEIVVPKTQEHYNKEKAVTEKLRAQTTYDISLIYFLNYTPQYAAVLRNSVATSDIIIIERPYLFDEVRKYLNGRPLFQRSQNIEYYFRKSNIPESYETNKVLKDLFNIEKACCECSEKNWACSYEDLSIMHSMYEIPNEKLYLLPNGVDCNDNPYISVKDRVCMKKKYGLSEQKIAMFIGGGHRPNIEACEKIYQVAPYCDKVKFIFAGNLCGELSKRSKPSNIALLGLISETTRKYLFSVADVALNPMYSGSGSNIKMFDYMAMGVPIITSSYGARGINDISTFHIANTVDELIKTINSFELSNEFETVKKARKMIEDLYDWKVIAKDISSLLRSYVE